LGWLAGQHLQFAQGSLPSGGSLHDGPPAVIREQGGGTAALSGDFPGKKRKKKVRTQGKNKLPESAAVQAAAVLPAGLDVGRERLFFNAPEMK